ncbi:MAG: hypothetical protein ACM3X0_02540 [Bacteroidota bacterium]
MMTSQRIPGDLRETAFSRRLAERLPAGNGALHARWLANRQTIEGNGALLDISSGGIAARMPEAPPQGRLLHASLFLNAGLDGATGAIQADLQVCGRQLVLAGKGKSANWIVHLAFETVHPSDEKRIAKALSLLKAGHS